MNPTEVKLIGSIIGMYLMMTSGGSTYWADGSILPACHE